MSCADSYGVGEEMSLDEDMDPEEMPWEFYDEKCPTKMLDWVEQLPPKGEPGFPRNNGEDMLDMGQNLSESLELLFTGSPSREGESSDDLNSSLSESFELVFVGEDDEDDCNAQ